MATVLDLGCGTGFIARDELDEILATAGWGSVRADDPSLAVYRAA